MSPDRQPPAAEPNAAGKDARLERLYDYTKWHLGIYIAGAGGLVALASSPDARDLFPGLFSQYWLFVPAVLLIGFAGAAGGTILSACTTVTDFDQVWKKEIGPFGRPWVKGYVIARTEHIAFWSSVALLFIAAMTSAPRPLAPARQADCLRLERYMIDTPQNARGAAAAYEALGCSSGR